MVKTVEIYRWVNIRWMVAAMFVAVVAGSGGWPSDFFALNVAEAASGPPSATALEQAARSRLMGAPYRMTAVTATANKSRSNVSGKCQKTLNGRLHSWNYVFEVKIDPATRTWNLEGPRGL